MRIIGPNCLGVLRPSIGLNASFASSPKGSGNIALISQSGAMAVALLDRAEKMGIKFSSIVSIGNKIDIDEAACIEACEQDKETRVIGLYLESIKDGAKFLKVAKRVSAKKPIVLIKAGVSNRGAKAVSSHTGALAGSTAALNAACEYAGIHRAETTEDFLDLLAVLSTQPALLSENIAIITNAGGPGVLATDAAERAHLNLPVLDAKTITALKKVLPPAASTANPVDVLGDALADRYGAAVSAVAADPNVDGIVALLTPQVMTPCAEIAKAVIETKKKNPLIPITAAFMGGEHVAEARTILRSAAIPCYETPEAAVCALASLKPKEERAETAENETDDDRSSAAHQLLKKQKGLLSEEVTEDLFALYDLPVPDQAVAESADQAAEFAAEIGFPVIAKVSSKDILHKTDIGGVRANLQNESDVKKAYADIIKNCAKVMPSAAVRGVLIQKFLPVGNEFIVGGIRDHVMGPLVMVGLGGIYTELFKDTVFRIAPVSEAESYEMLESLKSWQLLTGMRGKGALAIDELAKAVRQISLLISDCPVIIEIDLNPVLVSKDSIIVADAKVVTNN
jgi:acetyltransferase